MKRLFSIPREHGAYVVLFCSWTLGLLYAPQIDPAGACLSFLLIAAAFLAQEPIRRRMRARSRNRDVGGSDSREIGLVAVGAGAAVALALMRPIVLVLAPVVAAIIVLVLGAERRRKKMGSLSLIGFAGLALAAPIALIGAGNGEPLGDAVSIWALAAIFFGGSVYCVNIRLLGPSGVAPAIGYHALSLTVLGLLVWCDALPTIAVVAVIPAVIRLLWILFDVERYRALPLKRIGMQESILAVMFLLINVWRG